MSDATTSEVTDPPNPSGERLIDAALEMIAERGYDAMSVGALAERAGVDKSAVYWHFGSKEKLLGAVLERVVKECVEGTRSGLTAERPGKLLDQLILGLRDRHLRRGSKLRVLLVILLERSEVDANARMLLRGYFESASAAIAEGMTASVPGLGDEEARAVGDLVGAMIQGVFLRCLVVDDEAEQLRLLRTVREAIVSLVRSRLPSP